MNRFSKYFCLLVLILSWPRMSAAYQITTDENLSLSNDFVVSQGKNELSLSPGEEKIQNIYIVNRSSSDLNFTVSIDDFVGSSEATEAVKFGGTGTSIYPAKNWLVPEILKFTLKSKEKMTLPVMVKLTSETTPGGLYGVVLVSAQPTALATGNQVKTTARLASLFFVKVNGSIAEAGILQKFSSPANYYSQGPIDLFYSFKNTGNIYLNPHGDITIKNLSGQPVYQQPIPAYFVMPGATRQQKFSWQSGQQWGIYQATINLSRGYGTIIDRQSLYLYIFPRWTWFFGGVGLLAIMLVIGGIVLRLKKR